MRCSTSGLDGVQQENDQALAAIREVADAIYGFLERQLGAGVVGGRLIDLRVKLPG